MTSVRINCSRGRILGFEMTGHSGYAEAGQDIVCAAISAISQTAGLGIVEVLGIRADYRQDDARGQLRLSLPDTSDDRAEAILRTMAAGLENIHSQYPDFIRIMFFETEGSSQ